ncbi:MAG: hypothetical protein KKG00_03195 [Bacteroidetes bacterium]|nr:hypothetical protein [Bacteroidota bacterium]
MHRFFRLSLLLILAACLTACPTPFSDRNGKFQSTPMNLEEINSELDDYNSDLPRNKYGQYYLIFSSKRERKDVYNLVLTPVELDYDDRGDKLSLKKMWTLRWGGDVDEFVYKRLIDKANQKCNVLGPITYSLGRDLINRGNAPQNRALLLYADDSVGNLQIKFVHNFNEEFTMEGPFEVSWLNSPQDDAYPTFNADFSRLYFCSNRDGNFDIFEVALPKQPEQLLETLLSSAPQTITKNTQLSTPQDDKCPYFVPGWSSPTMYFTSNRPGGQGGFDLYYAQHNGTTWNTPVNMGSRINTAYDEYRPIVPRQFMNNFSYHLGIFSSNRPGGKGGFDLYMAGFLKADETKLSD